MNWLWLSAGYQLAVGTGGVAATRMPGIKMGWFGHYRLQALCSRRLKDSMTAGQGVLKKIGI